MFEQDESLVVDGSRFAEVLESKVEAREGVFAKPHPFLRTACRGLAHRLNRKVEPMDFIMATELYINDVKTGEDGFTREPMPSEVLGFPEHVAGMMIRGTAINLARTAFGEEFTDAVNALYTELTAKDQSS